MPDKIVWVICPQCGKDNYSQVTLDLNEDGICPDCVKENDKIFTREIRRVDQFGSD